MLSKRLDEDLDAVSRLVAIPSVSGDPGRLDDIRAAAQAVRAAAEAAGAAGAELRETDGYPLVLATWPGATDDAFHLLVYVHYDVQPEGEPAEWEVPPFAASRRGDRLIGRGSADDKGPIFMHLAAINALREVAGDLPVAVTLLVDGEEEIGSPSLPRWLEEHRQEFNVDLVAVSDTSMLGIDRPSIVLGTRGNVALELEVRTLDQDVHSGKYGGGVANAALVLARLLGSLHDATGLVTVKGFYDKVRPLSEKERRELEASQPPEDDWLSSVGARSQAGEAGLRLAERVWARPTLDVCGMWSGYTGPGTKTIIPAVATARISCRLVADQQPDEIAQLVADHLHSTGDGAAEVSVRLERGSGPVLVPSSSPVVDVAAAAYEWGYGKAPVYIREGGSIPIAAVIGEILSCPVFFLGFGLHGQQEHAPNEWLSAENFERAANAIVMFLLRLGADGLDKAAVR